LLVLGGCLSFLGGGLSPPPPPPPPPSRWNPGMWMRVCGWGGVAYNYILNRMSSFLQNVIELCHFCHYDNNTFRIQWLMYGLLVFVWQVYWWCGGRLPRFCLTRGWESFSDGGGAGGGRRGGTCTTLRNQARDWWGDALMAPWLWDVCFVLLLLPLRGLPQWWLTRAWRRQEPFLTRAPGTYGFTSPPKDAV